MRVFHLLHHTDIIQLDIQVLIHALQRPADGDVVFQLHGDFVVDERFEEAEEQHLEVSCRYERWRGDEGVEVSTLPNSHVVLGVDDRNSGFRALGRFHELEAGTSDGNGHVSVTTAYISMPVTFTNKLPIDRRATVRREENVYRS